MCRIPVDGTFSYIELDDGKDGSFTLVFIKFPFKRSELTEKCK